MHFVSKSCRGEHCGPCIRAGKGKVPARHKVGEEIFHDDPSPPRHNMTQYVCCACYMDIMGRHMLKFTGCELPDPKAKETA